MKRVSLAALAGPFALAGWLFAGAACSPPGSAGDDCVTPSDCEVGLQCYGGVCVAGTLSCGDGTVEQNGKCVAPPRRRCGPGTVEVDGVCELEPPPDAGPDAGDVDLDAGVDAGDDAGGDL